VVRFAHFGGLEQPGKAEWVDGPAQREMCGIWRDFDAPHLSALSGLE